MTRAAFLSLPARGHVNPSLPLVAELVRLGHEVLYFGTAEFRESIEETGAEFRPYPPIGYDLSRPDRNLVALAAALAEIGAALLPDILDALRSRGVAYVMHDSMAPWGRHAARILRVPAVCSTSTFAIHPAMNRSLRGLAQAIGMLLSGAGAALRLRAVARRLRSEHGVGGVSFPDVLFNRGDLTLVYTSRLFQPEADRFDESVRFVGPSLPAPEPATDPLLHELDRACAGGAPLVYVSLGTVFNDRADLFRTCVDAFAGTGAEVLLAAGRKIDVEDLGPLPGNVRVRPFVPQLEVLRRASLFVTHGGMNSVNEGLYFGVPLLLFPQMSEQSLVARRVEALGAGRVLGDRITPSALRSAAQALLRDPRHRERARWIGASLAAGGGCVLAASLVADLAETSVARPAAG